MIYLIKFTNTEGKTTSGIMLEWGKSSSGDNFNFEFNASGKYWIGEYYNRKYVDSKGWTASSSINKTSYNKLTVRKIGARYYFFINQRYVHSMPFKKFYGDKVAFTAPANSGIKIDYLTISYLEAEGNAPSLIWFLEHEEVITAGRSAKRSQLLAEQVTTPVCEVERGGKYTYHNPGQQIVYFIVNLKELHDNKPDIKRFVRGLDGIKLTIIDGDGAETVITVPTLITDSGASIGDSLLTGGTISAAPLQTPDPLAGLSTQTIQ